MSLAPFLLSPQPWLPCGMLMEPHYNEVPWYQKIVCYRRFFALAKQSEPRGSLGRRLFAETVKPHYKNFMTCLVTLACCSWQDKQSVCCCFQASELQDDWQHSASQIEILLALILLLPLAIACLQDFYGTPALTKCHDTIKIVHYSGVFAVAKQSELRGSLGRRKGRAWRNALMPPVHPRPYFKIFSRIVGA